MSLIIYLFEDHNFSNFYPLTYNRPVCELLAGINKLREKVAFHFPEAEIRLLCRDYLKVLLEEKTKLKVNDFSISGENRVLMLNGRAICDSSLKNKLDSPQEKSFWQDGTLVAVSLSSENLFINKELFNSLTVQSHQDEIGRKFPAYSVDVKLVNYLWDLVSNNSDQIAADFQALRPRLDFQHVFERCEIDRQAVIYKPENVYVGKSSKLEAFVVLNAERGPIFIDDDCKIQAFTRIEGPAYIGKNTRIFSAQISGGCSFGPQCRLGGEIQQSVFLGYSNKYHEGFMGHSYVGEWVNLGAGTFNSDLKNNYSNVRVTFPDRFADSRRNKIGSFIGDHAKTGIGTLLNTGSYLGLGCNIFGGGMIRAKFIPSFGWGNLEGLHEYSWDKFFETALVIMQRRGVELLNSEQEVLKKIFELTKPEREALFQS